MKFEKDTWRCEIAGAADMPMRAMYEMYDGFEKAAPVLARVVKSHNLTDWDGQPVDLAQPRSASPRQLQWLRECVEQAARDELVDPEA